MGMLDSRVAKLEAADGAGRVLVISIGSERSDASEAVAHLLPGRKPADLVVVLRRFEAPTAQACLLHAGR